VSSCTIPLDEEDEDSLDSSSVTTSPSGTIQTRINKPRHVKDLSRDSGTGGSLKRRKLSKLPEESHCELLAREMLDMMPDNDDNYKKLVSLIGKFKLKLVLEFLTKEIRNKFP
jgi:hypothetical protein